MYIILYMYQALNIPYHNYMYGICALGSKNKII